MLNIVATPIGNLNDISYRQAVVLTESDVILAEDTRSAQTLLSGISRLFNFYSKINQKVVSYYKEKEFEKLPEILGWLNEGKQISLISESGMPLISDPGYILLKEVVKAGIPYDVIPGSSAVTTALVLSGFQAKKFMFLGFLPKKSSEIKKLFLSLQKDEDVVFVAFESAKRIQQSLKILDEIDSKAEVAVCREMTKKFQEVLRGTPGKLSKKTYKGEITIVLRL